MKRLLFALISLVVLISACNKKPGVTVLTSDSPAYELGKILAEKLTVLDPDTNAIIFTSKNFDLSAGDVLENLTISYGKRIERIKTADINRMKALISNTVDRIAIQRQLLSLAKKNGFNTTQAEVDSALLTLYNRYGGEEKYKALMEENGVKFDFVKSEYTSNVIIGKYLKNTLRPTESELQTAYEESLKDTLATVRHILLMTQGKTDSEKKKIRKKIEKILVRAKKGEDFAALVTEFTEDTSSKKTGGLYEDFQRGQMVPPFDHASFTVPVGEISDIVETTYGFHILKIIARHTNTKSFEESKPALLAKLGTNQRQTQINFLNKLKTDYNFNFIGW